MRSTLSNELVWITTAFGLIATLAAPWLELRGTFAAWRIVEWHTFWRGENAFMLSQVVAANYRVPIEFATRQLQDLVYGTSIIGAILGSWHALIWSGLLVSGARQRLQAGASRRRVASELIILVAINFALLSGLAWLFALPSSLDTKVDFRPDAGRHTDSLIWSSATLLPVAPVIAIAAMVMQMGMRLKNVFPFDRIRTRL